MKFVPSTGVNEKNTARERMARELEEFKANGGVVEKLDAPESPPSSFPARVRANPKRESS